jgi:hypothetical protein
MSKSAIFILTQNNVERKIYLKTSLYFLFKNFNSKYKYPVIILHEGDYDNDGITEILLSIREESRHLVSFKKLDKGDFTVPAHIDKDKMRKCLDINPVPYWRNERYRMMCYFWMKHFFKYCKDYEYAMRLDDDGFIEEPIKFDMFALCKEKDLNYVSNFLHIDCSMCNYGMKDFFIKLQPEKKEKIDELFMEQKLDNSNLYFDKFKSLYSALKGVEYTSNEVVLQMPLMYYNNFCITKTSIWNTPEITHMINEIDKCGYVFYCRWGDGPLQTIIMKLYDNTKLSKFTFKYSKRLQRESFKDNSGGFHNYMPKTYISTSCITEK